MISFFQMEVDMQGQNVSLSIRAPHGKCILVVKDIIRFFLVEAKFLSYADYSPPEWSTQGLKLWQSFERTLFTQQTNYQLKV